MGSRRISRYVVDREEVQEVRGLRIDTKSIELGIQYVPISAIVAWLVSYSAPIVCGAVRRSGVSQAEGKCRSDAGRERWEEGTARRCRFVWLFLLDARSTLRRKMASRPI
jgi:hypothetical protein